MGWGAAVASIFMVILALLKDYIPKYMATHNANKTIKDGDEFAKTLISDNDIRASQSLQSELERVQRKQGNGIGE